MQTAKGTPCFSYQIHSYQIEQKDYVAYLRETIPAFTSHDRIWLFHKSVTLLIIISGILSYLLLHHSSYSAELLISQLFPEVILDVSDYKLSTKTHSEFSPSQVVGPLFGYLAFSVLINELYCPLYALSTISSHFSTHLTIV